MNKDRFWARLDDEGYDKVKELVDLRLFAGQKAVYAKAWLERNVPEDEVIVPEPEEELTLVDEPDTEPHHPADLRPIKDKPKKGWFSK